MKVTLLLTISALCLLSSGCALSDNLMLTSVIEPLHFSRYWDGKRQHHEFRKLANQELERARATARAELDNYACEPFSVDEESGFVDGFVDFLIYGGTANPPTLPPRQYWGIKYQNLDGYLAIQDWFKGFQHGAAVAQASGYREYVTVALSDSLIIDKLPIYPQSTEIENVDPDSSIDELPIHTQLINNGQIESDPLADDEVNDEKPVGIVVAAPEPLPSSPPTADNGWPFNPGSPPPKPASPATGNALLLIDSNPEISDRDSSFLDTSTGTFPYSSAESPFKPDAETNSESGAVEPSAQGVPPTSSIQPLPAVETESPGEFRPPVNRQQAIPPSVQPPKVRSLPPIARRLRSSKIGSAPEPWQDLWPDAHQASLISPEPYSGDEAMPDAALASFSRIEQAGEKKNIGLESTKNSGFQPRWPIFAGGLLFLAGITFLVRQRRCSSSAASQRHPQPPEPGEIAPSPTPQLAKSIEASHQSGRA